MYLELVDHHLYFVEFVEKRKKRMNTHGIENVKWLHIQMIHIQDHWTMQNTFIHLLKGQENQSMKLSKTKCAIFICKTKQENRYKMKKMSFNCKLFIRKQRNEIITKWKKWVSIVNYSYVNKIMKSLQNEKMIFNCKLFICKQNNENHYKMKKWVSIANETSQNAICAFKRKWKSEKENKTELNQKDCKFKKWAKKKSEKKILLKNEKMVFFGNFFGYNFKFICNC